ncbi:unnamed protein product [Didymodactylos carnosus]|uniref:Uncharacterized protein n=1 Tax=Didymodactylos carnosus TaxID=1234261 RepID=A0A8S2HFR6_9BILA|nr:unnamed protein product [Didymodactylos carnosus]CAF3629309.1 unnamed protein product [Didymodactylos carnosus]
MLEICRSNFKDNEQEENAVIDFQHTYKSAEALWWYTHELNTFLHTALNNALRTDDIKTIYHFRYFISDLYKQLGMIETNVEILFPFRVYRGQKVYAEEVKHLQMNISELLTFTTFFLTTTSSEIALSHITNDGSQQESVLFEIVMDIPEFKHLTPIFNIRNGSHSKNKNQYLFRLGSMCRLESIVQLPSKIWHIKLLLTDTEINESNIFINYFKKEFDNKFTFMTLGMFWIKTKQPSKALDYCHMLSTDNNLSENNYIALWNNIGLIYQEIGDLVRSRKYFNKALDLSTRCSSTSSETDSVDYPTAISSDIILKEPIINISSSRGCYYNRGCTMFQERDFVEALNIFKYALSISNDDNDATEIANIYNNIGCTYHCFSNYSKASEYFRKALTIGVNTVTTKDRELLVADYVHNLSVNNAKDKPLSIL